MTLFFSGEGMYFPFVDIPENGVRSFEDLLGSVTPPMPPAAAWGLFLVMLTSLVLWTAGRWTKAALVVFTASLISSATWANGTVLYKAMQGNWASPVSFWLIGQDLSLGWYDLGALFTKLFELFAAVFIFLPRWRPWVFAGGLVFHLSIAVLLGIWQFLFIPLTYVLFVEPRVVEAVFDERLPRLRNRFMAGGTAGAAAAAHEETARGA